MRAMAPVVQHAAAEWMYGAAPIHSMWQATLAGYLMGRGASPAEAISLAERLETAGFVPGFEPALVERLERAAARRGAIFGVPAPWGPGAMLGVPAWAPYPAARPEAMDP